MNRPNLYLRAGHALGALSAVLLAVAAVGWLAGGPATVMERLGGPAAGVDSVARAAGFFKGLLDLWPLPLAGWFAARRQWGSVAAVWAVALVFIPLADLAGGLLVGVPSVVHLLYAGALGGSSVAYLLAGRQIRRAAAP